jgi:hypothetical protein
MDDHVINRGNCRGRIHIVKRSSVPFQGIAEAQSVTDGWHSTQVEDVGKKRGNVHKCLVRNAYFVLVPYALCLEADCLRTPRSQMRGGFRAGRFLLDPAPELFQDAPPDLVHLRQSRVGIQEGGIFKRRSQHKAFLTSDFKYAASPAQTWAATRQLWGRNSPGAFTFMSLSLAGSAGN